MSESRKKNRTAPGEDDVRKIKKYPNRRLYDTATSSYVTLAEIKQLVIDVLSLIHI